MILKSHQLYFSKESFPSKFHWHTAIHCPCRQEKFRTSLASPWRDTKKLRFPRTIRKINLGILFQITILPITVGSLPKPSHRDLTLTFPDLQPCAIPRAAPSHMPQQGNLPVSLQFLSPWELIFSPRFSHLVTLFVARMRLLQYFNGARQLQWDRCRIKGIIYILNVL